MPKKDARKINRILVVNPFGIGDALFSMVLVEAVRKNFPDAVIGFVCNERTQEERQWTASKLAWI